MQRILDTCYIESGYDAIDSGRCLEFFH